MLSVYGKKGVPAISNLCYVTNLLETICYVGTLESQCWYLSERQYVTKNNCSATCACQKFDWLLLALLICWSQYWVVVIIVTCKKTVKWWDTALKNRLTCSIFIHDITEILYCQLGSMVKISPKDINPTGPHSWEFTETLRTREDFGFLEEIISIIMTKTPSTY